MVRELRNPWPRGPLGPSDRQLPRSNVTRQQKDGWEGFDHETHQIVPDKPADQQAAATGALPLQLPMHKGCTRDAQGTSTPPVLRNQAIGKPEVPGGEASALALGAGGVEGATEILSPGKRPEPNSPSPYPLPEGEGARPVVENFEAPPLVIARRVLIPLLWGEGRVRGNGCPELEMGTSDLRSTALSSPGV
jgi:hypothetical protein